MPTIRLRVCVMGAVAAIAGGVGMSAWADPDPPSFQGLGSLGSSVYPGSNGWSITPDGSLVVGSSGSQASGFFGSQGFRWTAIDGMTGLGDISGSPFSSFAYGVSDDGSVITGVGNLVNNGNFSGQACRWVDGVVEALPFPPGATKSVSPGVSGDRQVLLVGGYDAGISSYRAYRWTVADGYQSLGELSGGLEYSYPIAASADGSVIVGNGESANGSEGFRWTAKDGMQGLGDLPGGNFYSDARWVSPDGSIIVGTSVSDLGIEACRRIDGQGMIGLGDLPGGPVRSNGWAGSADGRIVVGAGWTVDVVTGNVPNAFIWDAHHGMRDLRQVLLDLGVTAVTDWKTAVAQDVSSDGRAIVGYGVNPQGKYEGFLARLNRAGDVNADGIVDISDLFDVINAWGPCSGTCLPDAFPYLTGDDVVDISDLFEVINNWDA